MTQEHEDVRRAVRAICHDFPDEYWRNLDRQREYPTDFVAALTSAGFLASLIPSEYGGGGAGLSVAAAILEEIHASGGNGAACHAQLYTMGTLLRHGSEAQRERWLPPIARGELRLQAFGVTEPVSGSDTLSISTRASRQGDGYVINGQKIWTSRAEHSDLMLLLARTTPSSEVQKRTEGLSVFLVDLRGDPEGIMIHHATTEVFFDDFWLPSSSLVGEEGQGFRYILDGMNAERILIASECNGDARWFLDRGVEYARDRIVFDRPIGMNQGIQFPFARAHAQTTAAQLMTQNAIELYENLEPCGPQANMAKLLASEASWAAAEACLQTHGGFGFAEEYDVERKFRETRLYQIAPVSTNMILAYIAEHVLGLPRSY